MSSQDLDKAIKSINESASRANTTTDFFNRVLDGGKTESAQNPLTGAIVPSVQKAVYDQYKNDINQIHQDVSDSREAADRSESAANAVWNRRTVYAAVNASFADYQEDGRTLTPRLSFDGSQYLPMFDATDNVIFTGLPVKNGDGTITVATDKGDRKFSCVDAEAVARVDLEGNLIPIVNKTSFSIPSDFSNLFALGEYLSGFRFGGNVITVTIAAGSINEKTLHPVFGGEFGFGRAKIIGSGTTATVLKFDRQDGIYAPAGSCFGKAPQYPVAGGDISPIMRNLTLDGINRDYAIDDPYRDAMGVRVFDGGVVVLDETVRITNFARVGVMAERLGIAFTPGVKVDTTGSDCFAASEGGYIYCPNSIADNPKGHCYIGYSGGQLYMPNCESKNAVLHTPANVGGSGLVLTGGSYAYAINHNAHHNAQRGVSIAMGSFANMSGLVENDNALPVTVSQDSTMVAPNSTITKPSGALALLVEKGGKAFFQIGSSDSFSIQGRVTVQSMGTLHAPDGSIDNSSGNSVTAINSTVDLDRTDFKGAPAVAIFAQEGAMVKCVAGSSQTTTGTTIIAQNAEVSADNFIASGTPSNGFRAISAGRIYAKQAKVAQAGQYGFEANGLGSFIDATGSTVGNAFTGYKALSGGQINATGTSATGNYGDAGYNPAINTADNKLTIIIK